MVRRGSPRVEQVRTEATYRAWFRDLQDRGWLSCPDLRDAALADFLATRGLAMAPPRKHRPVKVLRRRSPAYQATSIPATHNGPRASTRREARVTSNEAARDVNADQSLLDALASPDAVIQSSALLSVVARGPLEHLLSQAGTWLANSGGALSPPPVGPPWPQGRRGNPGLAIDALLERIRMAGAAEVTWRSFRRSQHSDRHDESHFARIRTAFDPFRAGGR